MSNTVFDVVIIGAGAAGLMCAITAGQRGRRVLVVEHANRVGKKILMSGGGRCNFTHLHSTPENFTSDNPPFCISALQRYTPYHFLEWVEHHGIDYYEKTPGQLFCTDSAKRITAMLLDECEAAGVEIRVQTEVRQVEAQSSGYRIELEQGSLTCESLVIATGGLSIPSMGASPLGYRIAEQFGLDVLPTRAGLGRRELSAPATRDGVRSVVAVGIEEVHPLEVAAWRSRALQRRLDGLFTQAAGTRRLNRWYDLVFVHHPDTYHLLRNSNMRVARWLEELGVAVRGPALWSSWRVIRP